MKFSRILLCTAAFAAITAGACAAESTQAAPASSAAAPAQETAAPIPAVISTGTENTIIEPSHGAPAFKTLERVETIVYGRPRDGGLINRLSEVERSVFGRELPGSLTERQTALLNFLEKGTDTQPSLLFKLSVTEWGVEQMIRPTWSLERRVGNMEGILEGALQKGALVSRVERLITKLLPDGIMASPFMLRKDTIVKGELLQTLTVRNIKKDDIIILGLTDPIQVGDILVAPKGSRVFAHITKVKLPRSFGRPSEIEMQLDTVEVLGPSVVAVNLGEAAKKAMEADSGMIGAAGASFAGALLLGPVGLAGGFLVRGNDKQLKEGTLFYVQTSNDANILSYKVPQQITPITQPLGTTPQGTITAPQM